MNVHQLLRSRLASILALTTIFAFACGALATVFIVYVVHFNGKISDDPAVWGQFGDFIGGSVNPILSFLSLIALLVTILVQTRQLDLSSHELELSRKELEATRGELRRSAEAHEQTMISQQKQAKAMEISARLSAITQLITNLDAEAKDLYTPGLGIDRTRESKIKNQRYGLRGELDDMYEWIKHR